MRILLAALLVIACAGCEELSPGWLIKDTRVLGATVSVDGDPTRSSPAAGERANVELVMGAPLGVNDTLGWAFLPCLVSRTNAGLPACGGDPLFDQVAMGTSSPPAFSFIAPTPDPEDPAPSVLIVGVVCIGGMPTLDAANMSYGCDAASIRTFPLTLRLPLQIDADTTNHNPMLAADVFSLDMNEWLAPASPLTMRDGCASMPDSSELPHVQIGTAHKYALAMGGTEYGEIVRAASGDTSERHEAITISTFVTEGKLPDGQFDVLADATPTGPGPLYLELEREWQAPTEVPSDGAVVRFLFVLRDGRGGQAYAERFACVVP